MSSQEFDRRNFISNALMLGAAGAAGAGAAASADAAPSVREAASAQGAPKSNYRFVSINRVLAGWAYAQKLQDDFKAEYDRRSEALQARQVDLQKKASELSSMQIAGSTEEARRKERELTLESNALKYDIEIIKKEKSEKRLRILLSEYQQIQEAAGRWAAQNGVDSVFVIQEEDPQDDDLSGRYERAIVRQVLWYSKELDITDTVLKLLQASGPVPAPAASRPAAASQPAR